MTNGELALALYNLAEAGIKHARPALVQKALAAADAIAAKDLTADIDDGVETAHTEDEAHG